MANKSVDSTDPNNPKPGDLHIDCTSIASLIVDLPPGAMSGMRRERKGIVEAMTELTSQQKTYGARAGISDSEVASLQTLTAQLALVRKYKEPLRKLCELIEETEASIDNERHQRISSAATSVDQRAKLRGNEDLLSLYRATREYRSALAVKAARTRAKNIEPPVPPTPPSA